MTVYFSESSAARQKPELENAFTVLDAVSALVLVMDLRGNIIRVNPAAERVTGFRLADALGKPVWSFMAEPHEQEHVRGVFRKVDPKLFPNQFEFAVITRNGQKRQIAWSNDLITAQDGAPVCIVSTGIDLTDLRRAGQELVRSEATNRALLNAIPDLIFRFSAEGVYRDCNFLESADLILPTAQLIGKSVDDVLPPHLAGQMHECIQKALKTGVLQVFQYSLEHGGEERYFEVRVISSGEHEVLAIVRNITEQKKAERILERKDAILEVVNFAAERFLASSEWEENIQEVLMSLGQATRVSRVYLFENQVESDGTVTTSQRYEWCAAAVAPQIGNPALQNAPYSLPSMVRLYNTLSKGHIFAGDVNEFLPAERLLFESQGIISIIVVPVFVRDQLWGFIGLDECRARRGWSAAEMDALRAAASLIGAALERGRMSKVLLSTLQVSQAAHSAQNLDELYRLIHRVVGELMPARSFYIALFERESNLLSFPYFVDEFDEPIPVQPAGRGLTEYVLRSGKALLSSPEVFQALLEAGEVERVGTPSIDWLGAPLQSNSETFGVLAVQSYTPGVRYKESDKQILAFVSTQVATAILRKQAEQALQRQLDELSVLHTVATAGAEAQTEDEIIELATSIIGSSLYPDNFGLLLIDPAAQVLRLHPSYHGLPEVYKGQTIPLGEGITGRVAQTGKMIYIPDVRSDPTYIRMNPTIRSEFCAPLRVGERILGVINAERSSANGFDRDDMRLLNTLGSQLATAIERKRTELALRSSEELYRSLVETSPDGVALMDLDGRVVLCNRRFADTVGCQDPDEVRGQVIFDLLVPGYEERDIALAKRSLFRRGSLTEEFTMVRRDGKSLPVELNATLTVDAQGSPISIIAISRDISERKRRDQEREAILKVASALRTAQTRADMVPVILANLLQLLQISAAALISLDLAGRRIKIELGAGGWAGLSGRGLNPADLALIEKYLYRLQMAEETRQDAQARELLSPESLSIFGELPELLCVPLLVDQQPVGLLCLGSPAALPEEDRRTLAAIADMAANAIHRATLHEQTQQRLQRLAGLRSVDMAITASLDLRVALNVLLDQIFGQLKVDAAIVSLFNKNTRTLEYSLGRGFQQPYNSNLRVRMGEGPCGQALIDRKTVFIQNLEKDEPDFLQGRGLSGGAFISYFALPLVAKGELKGLLEVFQRAELDPDYEWVGYLEALAGQAAIAVDNASLFLDLQRTNMELAVAYDTTLEGWVHALDRRDQEAEGHTLRLMDLTLRLAQRFIRDEQYLVHLRRGVLLHDIGKIAIPDSILLKRGPLNSREWELMRCHPIYAYDLLMPISFLRPAVDIPYCHHEKWDGSGYPRGLAEEEIPIAARLFSVADVYDVLRSDRPYRKAWSEEKTRSYLHQQAGRHFQPEIVEEFLAMLDEAA